MNTIQQQSNIENARTLIEVCKFAENAVKLVD
jgi:hypothetical protein